MNIFNGDFVRNKKGVIQVDSRGKQLSLGQSVLVMESVGYSGSRGGIATGVIVGFERYLIVALDRHSVSGIVEDRTVQGYLKFFEDKSDKKTKTWKHDYEELESRGLEKWPENVSPQYVIGCTEKVRRGWMNGTLFEG